MLGRLRMSLVDAEQAYLEMSEKIFNPKRHRINAAGQIYDFLKANGKFDAKALEQAIQSIIQEKAKLPVDSLLQEPDAQCKVWVFPYNTPHTLSYTNFPSDLSLPPE